jgi:hypothetical protein
MSERILQDFLHAARQHLLGEVSSMPAQPAQWWS